MKILVTGGSGFIGTNLIDFYLNKEVVILNVDISVPKKDDHFRFWEKADIRDSEKLNQLMVDFQPDYVIHLAARADQRGKTLDDYNANTLGVQNVMEACNKCDSVKKVIFTSTMLVCRVGYYPKTDTDYAPANLYGESKMLGEKIIRDNASGLHYKWSITRPTSIWGPWFGPTYREFFLMIMDKKYFNFSGKTTTKIYGYIDNTVYQINTILFTDTTDSGTYYLGDYTPVNIKDWANEIASEIGIKLTTIPRILIYGAAIAGDILKKFKIKFPMNSFRYGNMTTDNIVPLDNIMQVAPHLPVSRKDGNKVALKWLNEIYMKDKEKFSKVTYE